MIRILLACLTWTQAASVPLYSDEILTTWSIGSLHTFVHQASIKPDLLELSLADSGRVKTHPRQTTKPTSIHCLLQLDT